MAFPETDLAFSRELRAFMAEKHAIAEQIAASTLF
jgi:hypothetical protein